MQNKLVLCCPRKFVTFTGWFSLHTEKKLLQKFAKITNTHCKGGTARLANFDLSVIVKRLLCTYNPSQ